MIAAAIVNWIFFIIINDVNLFFLSNSESLIPKKKGFRTVSFFCAERGGNPWICYSAQKTKAKVMIFREISLIKVKFSLILILLRGKTWFCYPIWMQIYK